MRWLIAMASFLLGIASFAKDVSLDIGSETFYSSQGSKNYPQYGAIVSYTGAGFRVAFYSDAIVYSDRESAISSSKDVTIVLGTGVTVLVNGHNAGILSTGGNVVVKGPGTLDVRTREVWLLRRNVGIGAHDDVVITLGATVNVGSHDTIAFLGANCIEAGGKIKIELAMANLCCERSLLVGYDGVDLVASIVNLMQGVKEDYSSTAVYSDGGNIRIVGSVLSLVGRGVGIAAAGSMTIGQSCIGIVSKGIALSAGAGDMRFDQSRVMAISTMDSAVSLSGSGASHPDVFMYYRDENDNVLPKAIAFCGGEYRFGTMTNKTCIMGGKIIEIDGGHVECCAPYGKGAYSYDFTMRDGSLEMVDKMDYRECYKNIMAESAVMATVSSSGAFENGYGLKSALFTSMVEQFLLTQLVNPKGPADYAVLADTYRQYGGEVVQGNSKYGYLATKEGGMETEIWDVATPVLNGGVCHALLGARGWYRGSYHDYYELHPTNCYGSTLSRSSAYPYWTSSAGYCTVMFRRGSGGSGSGFSRSVSGYTARMLTMSLPGVSFTRNGYVQTGWSRSDCGPCDYALGASVLVAGNMVLYPHWEPTTYTINYDAAGGTGAMSSQTCERGRVYRLKDNAFSNGADRFVGWHSSANDRLYDNGLLVFDLAPCGTSVLMSAEWESQSKRYMVIDLSGGTHAKRYSVSYRSAPPTGGWTDEYKTNKLVLRRIEPGSFSMGLHRGDCPDIDDYYGDDRGVKAVSSPFYIGVFEVTQRQWELVMGTRPSSFTNLCYYATRPVESVSDDAIVGNEDSFIACVRRKTGLADLDLPTEVQWEYACRAGTGTGLNNGQNVGGNLSDANLDLLGRYIGNNGSSFPELFRQKTVDQFNGYYWDKVSGSVAPRYDNNESADSGTAPVGSYLPNAWGLYDMHGNVVEICAEMSMAKGGTSSGSGSASGASNDYVPNVYHRMRGGSWWQPPVYACSGSWQCWQLCCAAWRGFRIVCNLPE